jgi:cytochrome c oxidase subunit 2
MEKKIIPFVGIGALAALFSVVLLRLIAHVQMMPMAAAYEATLVDHAFDGMLKLTIPIFSVVVATILYCVLRFRRRASAPAEEGVKFYGSKSGLVETLWISASLVLTLGLAAFGAREFRMIRGDDRADLDVQVRAEQWSWEFFYPAYNRYAVFVLPKGKRVRLIMTSKDVIHSFWVPEFRIKQDIPPGKVVKLLFTPTRTGTYTLLCAELCGSDHTGMAAVVQVVEPEDFEKQMKGDAW